jgi:hypothetical protein
VVVVLVLVVFLLTGIWLYFILFCLPADGKLALFYSFCLFFGTRQRIDEENEPRECPWNPSAALALKASTVDIAIKKQRADIPKGRSALLRANGRTIKFNGDSYIKSSLNSDYKK